MLYELDQSAYEKVRPLYRELDFHLCCLAVLDGINPGRVFVDDPAEPKSSFMLSPEGCYLAGAEDNAAFNQALNEGFFSGRFFTWPDAVFYIVVSSDAWIEQVKLIFAPRPPLFLARRHYVCRKLAFDWRDYVPDGFTVQPITETLLNHAQIPDHILEWISNNWGSRDYFLQQGFGTVTLHGDKVVSWSLSDCVSGDGCEIGIHTDENYRQRGLAAITAAASVERAFSRGLSLVGWQCSEDNFGSIRTAEKVGFELERHYTMYFMFLDEKQHLAFLAAKGI